MFDVLPTRVGMVRIDSGNRRAALRSPHPRGDGPLGNLSYLHRVRFSPPAWGWSVREKPRLFRAGVLPTRVGMVRRAEQKTSFNQRSPHPRGDGPIRRGKISSANPPPRDAWCASTRATPSR